jgi:flagellar basal-body rod modification protein FlgD
MRWSISISESEVIHVVSGTTATTATTDTSAAAAAMKKSLGMNKDDFMKLFIAQLQYQDPLKPQDPTAMLDQLSQLSLVEQSYNSNTALNNLLTAQNNSTGMNSVSFIGKSVRANGNATSFDGTTPPTLEFSLAGPAATATVTITDAAGRTVRTATLGALAKGDAKITWDGCDNSGVKLPAGGYNFSVTAASSSGTTIATNTYTSGRIDGISFTGGKPILSVAGTPVSFADIVSVKGV